MESDFDNVPYYNKVNWLCRGKVITQMFQLKDEIQQFIEGKGYHAAEVNDAEWICGPAFLIGITHLNEINT